MDARKRLIASLVILFLVFLIGAAGFYALGVPTALESAFMTIITLTTLGARDVRDVHLGSGGELWTMILITVGFVVVAYAFSNLLALMTGGELRKLLGRRKLENKIKSMRNHFIICGYGWVGRLICEQLHDEGIGFVVIDNSEKETAAAEEQGHLYILGDASDEETLTQAGIKRAKGLVSVLNNDANNTYVALTARGLKKELMIVARAESQATERKLLMAGADRVVCPHRIGARRITNLLLRPGIVEFVDVAARGLELEVNEVNITEGSPLAGRELRNSRLREDGGVMVVAVKRADGTTIFSPTAETVLKQGDTLITIGQRGELASAKLV